MTAGAADLVAEAFRANERSLWGLLYRLTGSAADADDLVQETFARALERPPARTDEPLRPWLVRVAVNLGRDHLRKRRRRGYVGPWLPAPVEDEPPSFEPPDASLGPDARYDRIESVSFAFLLALEALTPQQRAVLLLRDVLDYSVRETADALGISEPSVKTTHHRARRAMEGYDRARRPAAERAARGGEALGRFLTLLAAEDAAGLEALFAEGARVVSDAAGEFTAARNVVEGRDRALRFLLGLQRKNRERGGLRFAFRAMNGEPAVVIEPEGVRAGEAPRLVLRVETDAEGRIREVDIVLATRKLARVRPVD